MNQEDNIPMEFVDKFLKELNFRTGGEWSFVEDNYQWCRNLAHPNGQRIQLVTEDRDKKRVVVRSAGAPSEIVDGTRMEGKDYEVGSYGNKTFSCTALMSRGACAIVGDVIRKVLTPWEGVWERQLKNLEEQKRHRRNFIIRWQQMAEALGSPETDGPKNVDSCRMYHYMKGDKASRVEIYFGGTIRMEIDIDDFDLALKIARLLKEECDEE